jgi:hypothetical protein
MSYSDKFLNIARQLELQVPKCKEKALSNQEEADTNETMAQKWEELASKISDKRNEYLKNAIECRKLSKKRSERAKLYQKSFEESYKVAQRIREQEKDIIDDLNKLETAIEKGCQDEQCTNEACIEIIKSYWSRKNQ